MGIESAFYAFYYKSCPWVDKDIAVETYLNMGRITTITFKFTFLHALLYIISLGYGLTL
jgi:hypothetical protein